eukprot:CAMPEP_0201527300 /NCGR_PEP_ID=MMETSP0161_2-20130828/34690_1 /ASSEMBLY_ACC=CAM_ASM_000251 /TAXON_ID=180227 /ORGANISM="Neoparamoeba aestuarina, Strain SoJaBio B1-5/56/2" /LENGTH=199 /DNA_ID=CAMNT_0047928061 /DNA_START=287 /DNA_END=886 /DNA_ORIENTATION=-
MNKLYPQTAQLSHQELAPYKEKILNTFDVEGFVLQDDGLTRRGTREYGYSFFGMEQGEFAFKEPPAYVQELGDLVCERMGKEKRRFTNIILSNYHEGFYLQPHADMDEEQSEQQNLRFFFAEEVFGVIIQPDNTGHLYFEKDGEKVVELEEKEGLLFALEGTLRHLPYNHAVTSVEKRRISVTFREVFRKEEGGKVTKM